MSDADDLESGEIEESDQSDEMAVSTKQSNAVSSRSGSLKRKLVELACDSEAKDFQSKRKKPSGKGYYDIYGAGAVPEIDIKSDSIRLVDVQQLVCFTLADGLKPSWVHIKNRPLIQQVVLVAVPGLEWPLQRRCKAHMPFCDRTFGKPAVCRVTTGTQAAGSALASLMTVAVSKSKKKEQRKEAKSKKHAPPPHPPSYYTLDLEAMRALKYPVPVITEDGNLQAPPGFVWTASPAESRQNGRVGTGEEGGTKPKAAAEPPRRPPEEAQWNKRNGTAVLDMPHLACGATLYALDCEMCITENGFELTRISMVDHTGKCVMDELVVPDAPITDYNTQYSGITAEMLEGVTTRLPDIQRRLCGLVSEDAILVGHSLENDFQALRFLHGNCIDTAHLYPHPKGLPHRCALRVLAERYLHRKIQQGSHDSVQDATAAMELALLKIKNGPSFGRNEKDGELLTATLSRAGCQCSLVDRTNVVCKYVDGSSHAHGAESDADVVSTARREISRLSVDHERPANKFVFARLLPLQTLFVDALDDIRQNISAAAEPGSQGKGQNGSKELKPTNHKASARHSLPSGEGPSGALEAAMRELDRHLEALWDSTAPGSLFLVVSLGGNTYYTRWLMETKLRRQQGLDGLPPWNQACEEHYAKAYDDAIRGCFFAAMKKDLSAEGA